MIVQPYKPPAKKKKMRDKTTDRILLEELPEGGEFFTHATAENINCKARGAGVEVKVTKMLLVDPKEPEKSRKINRVVITKVKPVEGDLDGSLDIDL